LRTASDIARPVQSAIGVLGAACLAVHCGAVVGALGVTTEEVEVDKVFDVGGGVGVGSEEWGIVDGKGGREGKEGVESEAVGEEHRRRST